MFPAEDAVSGATGRRVASSAGMLVWETPLGAHAAPEPELPALALARLEAMTGDFLAMWRRVNGR